MNAFKAIIVTILSLVAAHQAKAESTNIGKFYYSSYLSANQVVTIVLPSANQGGMYLRTVNMTANGAGLAGLFADTTAPTVTSLVRPVYVLVASSPSLPHYYNTATSIYIPPGNGLYALTQFQPGYFYLSYDLLQ